MSNEITISAMLEAAASEFAIFDMGRRIVPLDKETFLSFEMARTPYPLPLQKQAWFAIIGWTPNKEDEHFIWFLKFPLDELGLLPQVARDDFLRQLMLSDDDKKSDELQPSAYGFTPRQEKMAYLHSVALQLLGKPASKYYAHAREYLSGKAGYEQWSFVGLQGITDVVVRLQEENNENLLSQALSELPDVPLQSFCAALENIPLSAPLERTVVQRLELAFEHAEEQQANLLMLFRALARTDNRALINRWALRLLKSPVGTNIELLAAVAGRCWEVLEDEGVARTFMQVLHENDAGNEGMQAILTDLFFIPAMRERLLPMMPGN